MKTQQNKISHKPSKVHRKTRIRSGANKIAEVVGEKIKKQRERKKRRTLQNWRCFQLVRKPRSYMNTHVQLRSNVHLNAPIRSRLATPTEKTKTKKERKNALWFIVDKRRYFIFLSLISDFFFSLSRDSTTTATNLPKSHHQHHSTPTNRATKQKITNPQITNQEKIKREKITNPKSITQVLEKKKKNHNPAAHPYIDDNREKRRPRSTGGRSSRPVRSSNRAIGEGEKKTERSSHILKK